jgi:hypothetical protein
VDGAGAPGRDAPDAQLRARLGAQGDQRAVLPPGALQRARVGSGRAVSGVPGVGGRLAGAGRCGGAGCGGAGGRGFHGGFIAYAPSYGEMPGGFQGSVVVSAIGLVAGVSNNVNYDVPFGGSAAYNMPVANLASVTCTPAEDIEAGDGEADCSITGQLGIAVAGVPVFLQMTNESAGDDVSFGAPPATDRNVIAGVTNASGQFTANGYLLTGSTLPVSFTMNFYYDANNNGTLDAANVLLATGTCRLELPVEQDQLPS